MKFETKLNKILVVENTNLRKLKLINLSLQLVPQSNQQLLVKGLLKTF